MAEVTLSSATGINLASIQSGLYGYALWVIYGLIGLGVAIFGYMKWQDKKIYIYPVRIFRQRNNGMVKEFNTMGGYIKKGNITQFSIKMTKFKKKVTDKLPLSMHMDEDNRIYYWQLNPDAPLIQVKRNFAVEQVLIPNDNFIEPTQEEVNRAIKYALIDIGDDPNNKGKSEEEKMLMATNMVELEIETRRATMIDETQTTYSPVSTDLKQQALTDINIYKQTLGVDVNKQFAYFIIGVIAVCILAIVIFYIAMNKGDAPIITK